MVLACINNISTCQAMLQSAFFIAEKLKKQFGILIFENTEVRERQMRDLLEKMKAGNAVILTGNTVIAGLSDICESAEASFLFIQLADNKSKTVKQILQASRRLRIPYLLFKDDFPPLNMQKVLVPVIFLQEEIEKAQFAAAFGRFCNSEILVLQANDYGSKAGQTVEKMISLFCRFNFQYKVEKAKNDSYKVENEAVQRAEKENYGIVIISASREYGLDDVIFGPKELRFIKKSPVPLLLINPRSDLYALCD
jgi:hypothetical protein